MNIVFFFTFVVTTVYARPIVVLSYFDPFNGAPFNNSEKIAEIFKSNGNNHPEFEFKFCKLSTAFDKSFYQIEDCLKELSAPPKLVLSLGETGCSFKIETMAKNIDKTFGPDNDGIERDYTPIISGAPAQLGFTYPLQTMYCSLDKDQRKDLNVSNDAGSFVCNNLAYQFTHKYADLPFGFIHVPSNYCKWLDKKNIAVIENLEKMILSSLKIKTIKRLVTTKKEIEVLRDLSVNDKCLSEFYKRTKPADE